MNTMKEDSQSSTQPPSKRVRAEWKEAGADTPEDGEWRRWWKGEFEATVCFMTDLQKGAKVAKAKKQIEAKQPAKAKKAKAAARQRSRARQTHPTR